MTKTQPVEGDLSPPFRLYRQNSDGSAGDPIAEFWSLDEVRAFRRSERFRLDFKYRLLQNRKPIDLPW
jgi:hypothetical protein